MESGDNLTILCRMLGSGYCNAFSFIITTSNKLGTCLFVNTVHSFLALEYFKLNQSLDSNKQICV